MPAAAASASVKCFYCLLFNSTFHSSSISLNYSLSGWLESGIFMTPTQSSVDQKEDHDDPLILMILGTWKGILDVQMRMIIRYANI